MAKKFLKLNSGTTDESLVDVTEARYVNRNSATTVHIAYGDAILDSAGTGYVQPVIQLTHTSDTTSDTIESIVDAIDLAFQPKTSPSSYVEPTLPDSISITAVAFTSVALS